MKVSLICNWLQETESLLRSCQSPRISQRVHKSPPLVPKLSQMKPVSKIHLNIILPPTYRSSYGELVRACLSKSRIHKLLTSADSNLRLEVLMAVTMKAIILWDVTSYSLVHVYQMKVLSPSSWKYKDQDWDWTLVMNPKRDSATRTDWLIVSRKGPCT
jgi:hypothetical protein